MANGLNLDWRSLEGRARPWLIGVGVAILAFLVLWAAFTAAMTNRAFATSVVNWGLRTFADKDAHVQSAKLRNVFSSTFDLDNLVWPKGLSAKEVDVEVDPLGFLPARRWTTSLSIRDGTYRFEKTRKQRTIDPQKYVDRVDVRNVDVAYARRGRDKLVHVETASGSFAAGTVKARATAGNNRLTFKGLSREGRGGGLKGVVSAKGENLADLAEFVGAAAPDTPPFEVTGRLEVASRKWIVSNLTGRVGDSDVAGAVAVDVNPSKPFVTVDLASKELDFDDLGIVFGLPAGVGKSETTNEKQRETRAAYNRSSRLIPDARIDFTRLGAVNGDFSFKADRVVDAPCGVRTLHFDGELRDRVLDVNSFRVSTAQGGLNAQLRIDATGEVAKTHAAGDLERVSISALIGTPMVRGALNGKFEADLTGSSFRDAFGSINGEAGLWSPNSELAHIATEGAGLDIGEVLLDLAKEKPGKIAYVKSRCMVVNLVAKNGQVMLDPAILDNSDSLVLAKGGFNLRNEALDIKVNAHPKDVSFGTVSGEVGIKGTLRHPDLQFINEKALVQAGLAAALAAVSGPLGALPFIQTGGGEDADCGALLAETKAITGGRAS